MQLFISAIAAGTVFSRTTPATAGALMEASVFFINDTPFANLLSKIYPALAKM
jgi:hypothetical protein